MSKDEQERIQLALSSPKAKELELQRDEAIENAQETYRKSTYEAWKEYHNTVTPLREKLNMFCKPHIKEMEGGTLKANQDYDKAMSILLNEMKIERERHTR